MTAYQIPVLVSCYGEEVFTARVVDGPAADAAASSIATAMDSVKQYLRNQARRNPDQYWPQIDRYELKHTTVRVRLFYRDGKRRFPASREMQLPVRYVLGHYGDGSVECFLVDHELVFFCPALRELQQLIEESVRGAVAQSSSLDLVHQSPPEHSEVRLVRVRTRERLGEVDQPDCPTLAGVADPLVKLQRQRRAGHPTLFREMLASTVLGAIKESSIALVGDAGGGKTSLARLVAKMHQDAARAEAKQAGQPPPPPMIWESSAENLIAGMQYLGQWEERLEQVISELDSIDGVLLITSLVDLVRLGGSGPADSLASFLMPYVRRGEVRLIVEATPESLDATRRLLPGWAECFRLIQVETLSVDQTIELLDKMLTTAARNDRIEVADTAATTAARLFARFMPYQPPPRGAVALIKDLIQSARRGETTSMSNGVADGNGWPATQSGVHGRVIDANRVTAKFSELTGLPDVLLDDEATLTGDQVYASLGALVRGQADAVKAATDVVLRLKAGLCDPARPVATLLFCGPTGVGKTQLARSLSDYLFGGRIESPSESAWSSTAGKRLIRLDMSEYSGWDAVDRFTMSPDGEVAGWIGVLRQHPMSVLLLDEFEKASPEVQDALLAALDEGRLTDRFGRTTTLCGSIIVMTSNVGAQSHASVGFVEGNDRRIHQAIQKSFRPEFLNRLDDIVVFEPLDRAVIRQIVEKELSDLAEREALRQRRVRLHWDQSVVDQLTRIGFDPALGARPLQRVIERRIVARIARTLLSIPASGNVETIDLSQWDLVSE
ncbi:MAG: AAA family ATPase [Planctomycetota bacterium]